MKFSITRQERMVGVFILTALAVVVALLALMGANQRWFARNYSFYSVLNSGAGLKRSMPITLKGFQIGAVDRLFLNDDNTVTLQFHVYDTYHDKVTRYSVLQVVSNPLGLGGGLVLHPGNDAQTAVAGLPAMPEDYVPAIGSRDAERLVQLGLVTIPESDDVITKLFFEVGTVLKNLDEAVTSVNAVVTSLEESLSGEGTGPIASFLSQAESVALRLDAGMESVASRIDPIMANLHTVTGNLKQASDQFADPTGFVATLLNPQGSLATLLDDGNKLYDRIESAISEIDDSARRIREFSQFLSSSAPEVRILLEDGRRALEQSRDVLEGVSNNPLIRGGIPAKTEQTSTYQGYRDEDF